MLISFYVYLYYIEDFKKKHIKHLVEVTEFEDIDDSLQYCIDRCGESDNFFTRISFLGPNSKKMD